MNFIFRSFQRLGVPLLFAVVSAVVVLAATGTLDLPFVSGLFGDDNGFLSPKASGGDEQSSSSDVISDADSYVAVYLANGKVYFGKPVELEAEDVVLTNVYFLSLSESRAASQSDSNLEGDETTVEPAALQTEFQLVRLIDQFQAPVNELKISRVHLLFWEPLSSDSKVVKAIVESEKQ